MIYFTNLVKHAIETIKKQNPEIKHGYDLENISDLDKERILWYILQNYPNIAQNHILKTMVLVAANKKNDRENKLNEFLHFYFSYVLATECFGVTLKAYHISEADTSDMLEYILSVYPDLWNDMTLLQGIALFTRTSPLNWWD